MDKYCPDCNTALTNSIVGYLCHECGGVHRFNKTSTLKTGPKIHSSSSQLKPAKYHKHKAAVKSFIVPKITELPKNPDENHLIAEHATPAPVTATESNPLSEAYQSEQVPTQAAHSTATIKHHAPMSSSTITIVVVASLVVLAYIFVFVF